MIELAAPLGRPGPVGDEEPHARAQLALVPLDPIKDVQVLCPMNRGGLGARALNLELQRPRTKDRRSYTTPRSTI
jgi:ATP-dependent exoDNAse (exonuclease V) alpha subunit